MNFSNQKNGYNTVEVDEYLSKIERDNAEKIEEKNKQIDELKIQIAKLQSSSNSIALALTAAVDKAKEIEESSKNIYKLKIEQMNILYMKWEMLLNEMTKKYPMIKIPSVREDIDSLKLSIQKALKDEFNVEIMKTNPATDPIRSLLDKLTGKRNEIKKQKELENANFIDESDDKLIIERKAKFKSSDKTELSKLEEKTIKIKPIVNMNLEKDDKYENLVDKFLNSDNMESDNTTFNFSSAKKEDSGFDLEDCINPKDDLEVIMKSFDFFINNQ